MGSLPATLGPYRVVRQLGEGGMGVVFEAVHENIHRRVAIKVLHAEFARNPDVATRFLNEARAVNIVEHPGLVQVSDYGQVSDGPAYIVMEYLKGETLARRLEISGGKLSTSDALQIAWQIADSLSAAHQKGIIHRDLKPQNIMLVPDSHMAIGERAKVLDFGLAKVTDPKGHRLIKTSSNAVMGTPLYMSPEQCAGAGKVDMQTDVYSLGCMLYEMLGGRPPFIAEGAGQVLGMHMFKEPTPLETLAPKLSSGLVELVHRLLSKDREARPTMKELAEQLEGLSAEMPAPARSRPDRSSREFPRRKPKQRLVVTALVLLGAALGVLGWHLNRSVEPRRVETVPKPTAALPAGSTDARPSPPVEEVPDLGPRADTPPALDKRAVLPKRPAALRPGKIAARRDEPVVSPRAPAPAPRSMPSPSPKSSNEPPPIED